MGWAREELARKEARDIVRNEIPKGPQTVRSPGETESREEQ